MQVSYCNQQVIQDTIAYDKIVKLRRASLLQNFNTHTLSICNKHVIRHKKQFATIHAYTHCATPWSTQSCKFFLLYFNPRTQKVRHSHHYGDAPIPAFHPTLPHKVQRGIRQFYVDHANFNPHTHSGCDLSEVVSRRNCCISTHAPTKGATYVLILFAV